MNFQSIRGFLFDLDGVFYVGNSLIPGGNEVLNRLQEKNIPYRFITNTTTKSRSSIAHKLHKMGLKLDESHIISAVYAGVLKLREWGHPSCYYFLQDDAKTEFSEFTYSEENPDVIVLGDLDNAWDFNAMNKAFNFVMNGAKMLALHKGKYFQVESGLQIDSGAFINGIEYATGEFAEVVGKPQSTFFQLAMNDVGIEDKSSVIMIGDDVVNDIEGAQRFGMKGGLVKTGKFRESTLSSSSIKPDFILDSVDQLNQLL